MNRSWTARPVGKWSASSKKSKNAPGILSRYCGTLISVEDTEALLNMLMLLSTFMLAFSAGMLLEFDYSDVSGFDLRTLDALPDGDTVNLTSSVILRNSMLASTLLFCALAVGVGTYLSLCFSRCRDDMANFQRWARIHQWIIATGYILFVVGACFHMIATGILMDALMPKYCVTEDTIDAAWGTLYSIPTDVAQIYNASTDTLIELDGSQDALPECNMGAYSCQYKWTKYSYYFHGRYCFDINRNIVDYYKRQMLSGVPTTIFLLWVFGFVVQEWKRVKHGVLSSYRASVGAGRAIRRMSMGRNSLQEVADLAKESGVEMMDMGATPVEEEGDDSDEEQEDGFRASSVGDPSEFSRRSEAEEEKNSPTARSMGRLGGLFGGGGGGGRKSLYTEPDLPKVLSQMVAERELGLLEAQDIDLNLKEAELTCDDLLEHCHELMYIDRVLTESGLTKTGRRLKLIAALRRMKSVEDSRHLSTRKSRSHVLDSIRQTRPSNSKQNSSLKPSLVKGSSSTNPSLAMPGSTRDSKRNLVLP